MDMTRYKNNVEILKVLASYIDKYPEERFIQILWNLGIINNLLDDKTDNIPVIEDRFYEESNKTLQKIKTLLDKRNITC